MAPTNRRPEQVVTDVLSDIITPLSIIPPGTVLPPTDTISRSLVLALAEEGWLRTNNERVVRLLPDPPSFESYTLAEVRNGTGWPPGVRFLPLPAPGDSVDNPVETGDKR